jgi:hypothetical protein
MATSSFISDVCRVLDKSRFLCNGSTRWSLLVQRLKVPLKILAVEVKQNILMTHVGASVGGNELFSSDATVLGGGGAIIFSKFSKRARVLR